jgi:hypothetical protein
MATSELVRLKNIFKKFSKGLKGLVAGAVASVFCFTGIFGLVGCGDNNTSENVSENSSANSSHNSGDSLANCDSYTSAEDSTVNANLVTSASVLDLTTGGVILLAS